MSARKEPLKPEGSAIIDPARQAMLLSALYIAQDQMG